MFCWSIGIEIIVTLCLVSISGFDSVFSWSLHIHAPDESNVGFELAALSLVGDMARCLSVASARIKHSFRKEDKRGEARRCCMLRASRAKDIDVCTVRVHPPTYTSLSSFLEPYRIVPSDQLLDLITTAGWKYIYCQDCIVCITQAQSGTDPTRHCRVLLISYRNQISLCYLSGLSKAIACDRAISLDLS
jgi:hypothetical protein